MPFFQTMAKKKTESTESRKQSRMREREQEQQRLLFIALGVVAALIVIILAFGYWRTNIAILDETIATVNGTPIPVRDYQARARYDAQVIQAQLVQIQDALKQFDPNDPTMSSLVQYYQQQYTTLQSRLLQVPSNALEDAIDDELVRQEAMKRGITVTPAEVDREIELTIKESLGYPRPTATATEGPSPTSTATATATAIPTNTATPSISPTATATLTATLTTTPTAGPTETPSPTQTPLSAEAYSTEVGKLKDSVSKGKYSYDDYRKIVETELLRTKLNVVLGKDVPTTGEQVHVRHILVKTFDEAQKVEERLKAGEDFGKIAQEVSTDPSAKTNKGDLGWAPRGTYITEFENAAFSLNPLQISDPVTTTFGVHVIQLLAKDPNHPLEAAALASKRASALTDWLQKVRADKATNIQRFFASDYVPSEIKRLQTPVAGQ
jgi:parvulin-like peptidyl-prolyl isomerase